MGILKNFFTGASLSDNKRQSFQQRLAEEEKTRVYYKAVCKVCGKSAESSNLERAVREVQGFTNSRCGYGNHDIQVFQV